MQLRPYLPHLVTEEQAQGIVLVSPRSGRIGPDSGLVQLVREAAEMGTVVLHVSEGCSISRAPSEISEFVVDGSDLTP